MITLLLVLFIVLFALSTVDKAKFLEFKQSVTRVPTLASTPWNDQDQHQVESGSDAAESISEDQAAVERGAQGAGTAGGRHSQHQLVWIGRGSRRRLDVLRHGLGQSVAGRDPDRRYDGWRSEGVPERGRGRGLHRQRGYFGWTVRQQLGAVGGPGEHGGGAHEPDRRREARARSILLGYGQYHPLASNSSPAGRAQNRRVNIVVKPDQQVPPVMTPTPRSECMMNQPDQDSAES